MNKHFKNRYLLRECKRLIRVSLFSLYAALAFNTNSSIAAPAGKLEDWRFYPQGSQLEISLSGSSRPQYFYLSNPPRIVVDLPDTKLGYVPTQQNYNGAIERIRVSQLNDDVTRIVMDLAPGTSFDNDLVQLQPDSWQNPTRWLFRPIITANNNYSPSQYQSVGGELPPGATVQLPPGAYSPSQSLNIPYTPQPPGAVPVQPSGVLPPLQPAQLPPGVYSNPSQLPPGINTPSPSLPAPLPLTPIRNGNLGQPTVTVPPITTINSSPQLPNSVLPPAKFPSPSGNFNSSPSFFPTPVNQPTTNTTNSVNSSGSRVIEFGQPFPNPSR
ncbi:MAG: AMIN domain-containing protein [Cyanobacteria bacterium P01_C01_bin.38]